MDCLSFATAPRNVQAALKSHGGYSDLKKMDKETLKLSGMKVGQLAICGFASTSFAKLVSCQVRLETSKRV